MSDQHEPLSAILAEMRDLADHRAADAGGERPGIELLRSYADRIEAAADRERNAHTNDIHDALYMATGIPGNVAAMRDLLEKIRHEYGWGRIGCRTCVSSEADVGRVSDLFEKQIDATLSAPARNCDRFATEDEAREAYWAYREPLEFNDKPFVAITEWLFATAEGGDHA